MTWARLACPLPSLPSCCRPPAPSPRTLPGIQRAWISCCRRGHSTPEGPWRRGNCRRWTQVTNFATMADLIAFLFAWDLAAERFDNKPEHGA
eukprot:5904804-Pyramimonas_sp.AAC.1